MADLDVRSIRETGVSVTELGFGGGPLGALGPRLSDEDSDAIVRAALDAGVRYFDTAPLYGHGLSEQRVGRVLAGIPRDSFVISSKVGRLLVPRDEGLRFDGMLDEQPYSFRYDYSAGAVRRSIEESLERLGLDSIDIALCHDIDIWTHGDAHPEIEKAALEGAVPELVRLRDEGLVKAVGLGVNEAAICRTVLDRFDVDVFLLAGRFTLLEQDSLDELVEPCAERDVKIVIGGPYNSGLLAVGERRFATHDYKPATDDQWDRAQAIRAVCDAHEVDIRAAALQYPLRHRAVAAMIPGVRSVREVTQNRAFITQPVPDALWDDLAAEGLARRL